MGKRSNFKRRPQDAYDTPLEAVRPLIPHLKDVWFWEPCAGNGALIRALGSFGIPCHSACDVEPRGPGIGHISDPLGALVCVTVPDVTHIITNPPWTRSILHPMIEHFSDMRPTWLLFDADWMHTKQAAPYLPRLRKIVSVGRVKWIPDSPHTGKDNCAWYLFDKPNGKPPAFYGRQS